MPNGLVLYDAIEGAGRAGRRNRAGKYMARALLELEQAAGNDAGVPLPGAARTGKALFALALHRMGARLTSAPDEFAPTRKQVINH